MTRNILDALNSLLLVHLYCLFLATSDTSESVNFNYTDISLEKFHTASERYWIS